MGSDNEHIILVVDRMVSFFVPVGLSDSLSVSNEISQAFRQLLVLDYLDSGGHRKHVCHVFEMAKQ
jgi:hypothetical protein